LPKKITTKLLLEDINGNETLDTRKRLKIAENNGVVPIINPTLGMVTTRLHDERIRAHDMVISVLETPVKQYARDDQVDWVYFNTMHQIHLKEEVECLVSLFV
jgi:hypothetical protein